jgi:triosephosphate isomerase (TIM)
MRQQIVAGNWKMNTTPEEGVALAKAVIEAVSHPKGLVIMAPPSTHLHAVAQAVQGHEGVFVAAQNCHEAPKGAFTGEISVDMVAATGATYVILGHSERRQYFGESEAQLANKTETVLAKGLRPIFCCGEPLEVRENGTHEALVEQQLNGALFHLSEADFRRVVIAYEPVWAIGTGRTASSAQAQEMHAAIRKMIAGRYGADTAEATTILYGGSCNAQNAPELFSQPDVDGGLIGGASLKAADFAAIVAALK